jgi:hypothetical protein
MTASQTSRWKILWVDMIAPSTPKQDLMSPRVRLLYAQPFLQHLPVRAGTLPGSSADYRPVVHPSLTQPQHSMYPAEAFSAFRYSSPRVTETSLQGADPPLGQLFQGQFAIIRRFTLSTYNISLDLSLQGTSDPIYEPAAQPFQGVYFEEHVPSSSSARPDKQRSAPVAQSSQVKDKVKCTWNGCSALVNKDNLTRHVKEVHERKIKAVCVGCGREFKRPYQMHEHIIQYRCGRS